MPALCIRHPLLDLAAVAAFVSAISAVTSGRRRWSIGIAVQVELIAVAVDNVSNSPSREASGPFPMLQFTCLIDKSHGSVSRHFQGAFMLAIMMAASLLGQLDRFNEIPAPGMIYSVSKRGEVLEENAFGYADVDHRVAIDRQTTFNLASNSKQFTGLAILLLESEGKLSLEDSVRRIIPELPAYVEPVKIKHLVFHTSGMPSFTGICSAKPDAENADVISYLATLSKLDAPAGAKHVYSNTGYVLLSEVVARVSGKSFPEFLDERVFRPLGMTRTYVMEKSRTAPDYRFAKSYGAWPFFRIFPHLCNFVEGYSGVVSSEEDYQKWLAALRHPGFLKPEQLSRYLRSGTTDSGESVEYAFGWISAKVGDKTLIAHEGSWEGYRSAAYYLVEDDIWVTILTDYKETPVNDLVWELLEKYVPDLPR